MMILVSRILVGLLLCLIAASFSVQAQVSKQQFAIQKKIDFEVVSVADAHVSSTVGCRGLKLVEVYVSPEASNRERIAAILKEIALSYPPEYDLLVRLFGDRKYLGNFNYEEDSEEEVGYFRAIRGLYARSVSRNVEKNLVFPLGTTSYQFNSLTEP